MKKTFAIHPVPLSAFPVISLYAVNLAMVPLNDVWEPLGISVATTCGVWAVASLAFRSLTKGALVTALIVALTFSYGPFAKFVPGPWLQLIDVGIIGVVVWRLAKTNSDLKAATRFLNFGAVALTIMPVFQIISKRPPGSAQTFLNVSLPTTGVGHPQDVEKPDVFFIIVDGYGREDQLQRVMGYSNSQFVSDLRAKGFFVADQSHSTYVQTQLSLASTLNLSFLQDFPKVFSPDSDDRRPLLQGMDKSFAAAYFKKLGYQYLSVTSGFNEVDFPSSDLRFDRPLARTMLEQALLQLTPITLVDSQVKGMFNDRRASLAGALKNLVYLSKPTNSPRFVVVHLLAPHPPFVFDADGRDVRQKVPFGFWDGSHYMAAGGTPELYTEGYTGQVQFLNRELLKIVDNVILNGKIRPVVIIEGDHGSKERLDQESLAGTDVHECFGNFMAFYVPPQVRSLLYPQITSVNTFRVLLDGLFHEKLPLLPDKSYYSPFSNPYRFTDVTARVAD